MHFLHNTWYFTIGTYFIKYNNIYIRECLRHCWVVWKQTLLSVIEWKQTLLSVIEFNTIQGKKQYYSCGYQNQVQHVFSNTANDSITSKASKIHDLETGWHTKKCHLYCLTYSAVLHCVLFTHCMVPPFCGRALMPYFHEWNSNHLFGGKCKIQIPQQWSLVLICCEFAALPTYGWPCNGQLYVSLSIESVAVF